MKMGCTLKRGDEMFKGKDVIDVDCFNREEMLHIFQTAKNFKEILTRPIKKVPALRGKRICNLFFEPSTRTRISFEIAEKTLSADVTNFSASTSSLKKGESFKDTILTLSAMGIDMYVIRHSEPGAPLMLKRYTNAMVINAGDGIHAHPTQAILDGYTIWEKKKNFESIKIAIIGDISHSRVARSDIKMFRLLGAKVVICAPYTLLPMAIDNYDVIMSRKPEEAIENADVVMGLRMQLERQTSGLFPSLREYNEIFGITQARMKLAKPDAILMHPGPINRGVELDSSIADAAYSVIPEQVTNGVATRMALLYLLFGGVQVENID